MISTEFIQTLDRILKDPMLPDINIASVELGDWSTQVPLSVIKKHFKYIKIGFVPSGSDSTYAYLNCKIDEKSPILFSVRVLLSELIEKEKEAKPEREWIVPE
jgi:hypothetical protein